MAVPTNVLQQVQTYVKAELAWLLNEFVFINTANKKFERFNETAPGNLGDVVTFDKPPRYQSFNGLVITQQPSTQRVQSLTCSQAQNISSGYTDQQFIFNVREYMDRFGKSAALELGSRVEMDIALNAISGVKVNDPQNPNINQIQTNSGPYRFYGDGVTAINSFGQLAQSLAQFRSFGAAQTDTMGILPTLKVPDIVNTGLNQFALKRNNDIAESWELGSWANCRWTESNLLPIHVSGSIGDAGSPNNILTVISTNDPTGQNVTQITCSEPTSGTAVGAIQSGDLMEFQDGVSGFTNVRTVTFIGHAPTALKMQLRSTTTSNTTSGTVTFSVYPALVWADTPERNLNTPILAGMKLKVTPSHQAGLIHSGNQFYLAMPRLPNVDPYSSVIEVDSDSGASIRHYWGSQLGQNNRTYVRDEIHGSTLVPDNCMRLLFPL